MSERLALPAGKIRVVFNGIALEGYREGQRSKAKGQRSSPPILGYFARMCREKGLDLLVEAFIQLKRRGRVPGLWLRVGGGCGPTDEPFVNLLKKRLGAEGLADCAEFHPNLDRERKIQFYQSLTVFSVPALSGEAFGLYLPEAMAAAVPVVQPRHAASSELIEATGGGLVCNPTAAALADGIEQLLLNPEKARTLGEAGRKAIVEKFTVEQMAANFLAACQNVIARP